MLSEDAKKVLEVFPGSEVYCGYKGDENLNPLVTTIFDGVEISYFRYFPPSNEGKALLAKVEKLKNFLKDHPNKKLLDFGTKIKLSPQHMEMFWNNWRNPDLKEAYKDSGISVIKDPVDGWVIKVSYRI